MENHPDRLLDPQDELKADNEILRIKLELEHHMIMSETSQLDPELENQWLNRIYNFENQYKDAKPIKVHAFLGHPDFRKIEELKPEEVSEKLKHLLCCMKEKMIVLEYDEEYGVDTIYRFITEELFEQEMEDISMDGFVHHFIYEDFHPNHTKDLRRYADEFIEAVLRRKLNEFDAHCFAETITFKGTEYDLAGILAVIGSFQEGHRSCKVDQFQIHHVNFDLTEERAKVKAWIQYTIQGDGVHIHQGSASINFIYQFGYWYINGFQLPGFGG
jgi:hypothetical protein